MRTARVFPVLSLAWVAACTNNLSVEPLPSPVAAEVVSVDLQVDGETIHLLTGEKTGAALLMNHRKSRDGGKSWTEATRVDTNSSAPFGHHRSNDAQIAASGERVVAIWFTAGSGWGGSGPLVTAVSADGGASWKPGANPADDNDMAGHGFVDAIAHKGSFHAVWLDGRGGSKQGLRYAKSADGGLSWERNQTIASGTCECCWNSMLATDEGLQVLYRELSPRDMALAVSKDSGASWSRTATVGAFNWNIDACPHVGGAIAAARSQSLHALVWTGKKPRPGVYHSHSDSGKWSAPIPIGGVSAKHADIAASDTAGVVAVWDERAHKRSAIYAALFKEAGWARPVKISEDAASASHPRIVAVPGGFLAAWTESGSNTPQRLSLARIERR
ncbi:MAG: sialidase family protein [Burkholderiales bacterium]